MSRFLPLLFLALSSVALGDADAFTLFKQQTNVQLPNRFTFIRIEYDSYGGWGEAEYEYDGRHWYRWETDYPEADENFVFRLDELTTINPNPRAETRRFTDKDLTDFPFVYLCDVGWMELSAKEILGFRKYLKSGGFAWVDDFWGDEEFENFELIMKKVFPDLQWRSIPRTHPILNIVYPLESCPQIPARDFAGFGQTWDPPGIHKGPHGFFGASNVTEVHLRGWFDKEDRLMVVCTHNTDIGDGFEREAEDEWYFETFSTRAYAIGINILVYALTH